MSMKIKIKLFPFLASGIMLCIVAICFITRPLMSNVFHSEQCACAPLEIVVELNEKIYSVIYTKNSPAFKYYNLEKNITPDLVGEYLGEYETPVDNNRNEIFKIYSYKKCETTQYDWMPILILEDSNGKFYHAIIGSPFDPQNQTAQEVLTVYGIKSAQDIVSIENKYGTEISDIDFIKKFYDGLFTKEFCGDAEMREYVYQNTGLPKHEVTKLYSKYADDTVTLKLKLKNGLVTHVTYTSHNFVKIDHHLYFKVDDSWLDLVAVM